MTKLMDIREFCEAGYLQELNRNFLHPLGLALGISCGGEGLPMEEPSFCVYDGREDLEGMMFSKESLEREVFVEKAARVGIEMSKRLKYRAKALGFCIQPLLSGKTHEATD